MTYLDYVNNKHAIEYKGVDDDMVDDFNDWLTEQDPLDIIEWAEDWHRNYAPDKPVYDFSGKEIEAGDDDSNDDYLLDEILE